MLVDLEAEVIRNHLLSLLDRIIDKLLYPPASDTDDMIVVLALVQFKNRIAVLEVMLLDQPGGLKLGQYPIDRGQSDILIGGQQHFIDIFRADMPFRALLQQLQNLYPRRRNLQTRFSNFLFFQNKPPQVFSYRESGIIPAISRFSNSLTNRNESMQKLLIYWVCGASLLAAGCSTVKGVGDAIPNALNRLPLIHRPDVQQGNVVTQESINKLKPGMSKSQASYLLGTPMLVDVFHQDRWDYLYSMKPGNKEITQKRVTLYFADDRLIRIEGDYRPEPTAAASETKPEDETIISVPDYTGDRKGLFSRALESVGIDADN